MNDSADIRFLLTVEENGSLVATARKLGLTPSAVWQSPNEQKRMKPARRIRTLRFIYLDTPKGWVIIDGGGMAISRTGAHFSPRCADTARKRPDFFRLIPRSRKLGQTVCQRNFTKQKEKSIRDAIPSQ